MFSSPGDVVCTSIIEMVEIFNLCLGAYQKFWLRLRGVGEGEGAPIWRVGAWSISREERFSSYLGNRT